MATPTLARRNVAEHAPKRAENSNCVNLTQSAIIPNDLEIELEKLRRICLGVLAAIERIKAQQAQRADATIE